MKHYIVTTRTKRGNCRAYVVVFLEGEKTWRNLGWFGNTLFFSSQRLARLVATIVGADEIGHYPYPKRCKA